ncbi:hypothetical protein BC629DRAFT_30999 [Irpex lacteus]|nr:hypothetical protein BC629DRAFT_30999 [Irpex lacteus]
MESFTGTIYFLILLVMNILQMMQNNMPVLLSISLINPFTAIAPPMIVCRFILNLRQCEPAGSSWASANQSRSLRFVGNMGQSLQFGDEDANGEEEDVPGVAGTPEAGVSLWPEITTEAAEDPEVNKEYVGRSDNAEKEPTYADV